MTPLMLKNIFNDKDDPHKSKQYSQNSKKIQIDRPYKEYIENCRQERRKNKIKRAN
jgi:hypothetical protein